MPIVIEQFSQANNFPRKVVTSFHPDRYRFCLEQKYDIIETLTNDCCKNTSFILLSSLKHSCVLATTWMSLKLVTVTSKETIARDNVLSFLSFYLISSICWCCNERCKKICRKTFMYFRSVIRRYISNINTLPVASMP